MDNLNFVNEIEIPKINYLTVMSLPRSAEEVYAKELPEHCIGYDLLNGKFITSYGPDITHHVNVSLYDGLRAAEKEASYIYYKYIAEYHIMMVCKYRIDATFFKIGECREWEIMNYYFLTDDKNVIYKKGDEWIQEEIEKARFNLPFSMYDELFCREDFIDEATKMYGLYRNNSNMYDFINNIEMFKARCFNENMAEVKATKKLLKIVDETLKINLAEVTDDPMKPDRWRKHYKIAKLQKVNNDVAVMRFFINRKHINYEYMRFYVTEEANFLCHLDNDGKFHLLNRFINKDMLQTDILCYDKDEIDETAFKYMLPIIDDLSDYEKAYELYELFNFGILERLCKSGMPNLVTKAVKCYRVSRLLPTTTIGNVFSCKIKKQETDIFKALGLNKYQYKNLSIYIDSNLNGYSQKAKCTMSLLRVILKGDPFSPINDVDNKTFDNYLQYAKDISCMNYCSIDKKIKESIVLIKTLYSEDVLLNTVRALSTIAKSASYSKHQIINLLYDFLLMVKKLNDARSLPLKYSNINNVNTIQEDIRKLHDVASNIYETLEETVKMTSFTKSVHKCKKWIWTDNEHFQVVIPSRPGDLAKEGLELHHCVKSYIDRVCEEKTNVVFIRQIDALDKPFFTVEISNTGYIEQVHGFGNRNSDTEPGLDNFIEAWAKATKLKISNFDKVR